MARTHDLQEGIGECGDEAALPVSAGKGCRSAGTHAPAPHLKGRSSLSSSRSVGGLTSSRNAKPSVFFCSPDGAGRAGGGGGRAGGLAERVRGGGAAGGLDSDGGGAGRSAGGAG